MIAREPGKRGNVSRRDLLKGALGAAAAFTAVPRYVLGGSGYTAPSEKLNIALIGAGGRGKNLVREIFNHRDAQVMAICDPNEVEDYSAFYYRTTSGRVPVLKMVREHYGGQAATEGSPGCSEHLDFRKMLDQEKSIDAVVVATPDHVHAVACMAAIKLGKHVYCEKPLTRSVYEARALAEAAREAKVATQMGNQGHSGAGIRSICEWIWDGAIGAVRQVYAWSDTGYWTTTDRRPKETPPVPSTLDWDLWLGPVPYRPYHPAYVPYNWRGWWDFGTGAIGDMGCHNMDPAFWALKLGHPSTVEASSARFSSETTPNGCIVRYEFAARGDMPPVKLTWYDGGLRPPRPPELEPDEKLDGNGIILVGDKGTILCGGWSRGPRLIPPSRMREYKKPPATLPRSKGFMRDWLDAAKGGPPASSNFSVAGPMVEVILLGNVALRTGKKLQWDGANLKATNAPEADRYIRPPYRNGWAL